jgi:hypothetical protein
MKQVLVCNGSNYSTDPLKFLHVNLFSYLICMIGNSRPDTYLSISFNFYKKFPVSLECAVCKHT